MKINLSIVLLLIAQLSLAQTKLVLLGTGTPFANPDRSGPALAIVVNGQSYVVDAGPGVVRRASLAFTKGINGLDANQLKRLFITHLHSDHTAGLTDFIFTPAVLDRNAPLEIYGPKGIKYMVNHFMKAFKEDMDIRIHGLEFGDENGYQVNTHEIKPGLIYQDSLIKIKAFKVNHGAWKNAYGYRFETADKVIVVSGDCTYSESLIENAKDCDILVHEVFSMTGLEKREHSEETKERIKNSNINKEQKNSKTVEAKNIETGDLIVFYNISQCSRFFNATRQRVKNNTISEWNIKVNKKE
jgi:ribonuclease BN (tRNA processing enzyme)